MVRNMHLKKAHEAAKLTRKLTRELTREPTTDKGTKTALGIKVRTPVLKILVLTSRKIPFTRGNRNPIPKSPTIESPTKGRLGKLFKNLF